MYTLCLINWSLFITLVLLTMAASLENGSISQATKIHRNGDVMFGGLFPMHEKGILGDKCGKIKTERGIQRLEAMLYAVDLINKDPHILPNMEVGVHILDTCSFDTYALEQTMDFIKSQLTSIDAMEYQCRDGQRPKSNPIKPVAGVIGAASSTVSIMVANILRLFKIPQISYSSTSIDLSDKTRFEYFSRVVPPDSKQAKAMVDIAKALNWTYVIALADEGNYGEKGIGAFEEMAKEKGVCIAHAIEIPLTVSEDTFYHLVQQMHGVEKANAVVMFVNEDNSRNIMGAMKNVSSSRQFTYLASDSWGAKKHPVFKQESIAEGAVTILPKRVEIPGFDKYFLNLTANENHRNPWFKEYWEVIFNCTFKKTPHRRTCTGVEQRRDHHKYQQEGLVQFVIDSVYGLAHALHNMLKAKCGHSGSMKECSARIPNLAGEELLKFIRNVSFVGSGTDVVRFDENGDGYGNYDIFQFQRHSPTDYGYVLIGEWTNDGLVLNHSLMDWRNTEAESPKSVCSEPCAFGYAKKSGDACCWVCIRCGDFQILENESNCKDCPDDEKPDETKTKCIPLPVLIVAWSSVWGIIPVVTSSLGILSTILVLAVFLKYNTTPVIMASGRELCYFLLLGIFLSYAMSFIILTRPTPVLCTAKRLGLGVSLCLIYASMLTKTNRIYRIFNRGVKAMVKRPSYTSPRSQIVICLCLVSVQVVGGLTWLGFEVPATVFVKQGKDALVLKCKTGQTAIIISLFYNMILIILCTVYAFKTRKIPQNFNEAKYIAFTMYSTCIVWLAFIPIYFGANNDFKIELTSICMCISISATVALACLFAPKIYIVLFQPHKNVRQVSTTSSNTQTKSARAYFAHQQNKIETSVTYNGTVVASEIHRTPPPEIVLSECETSSCDEGVAMQTPST